MASGEWGVASENPVSGYLKIEKTWFATNSQIFRSELKTCFNS